LHKPKDIEHTLAKTVAVKREQTTNN